MRLDCAMMQQNLPVVTNAAAWQSVKAKHLLGARFRRLLHLVVVAMVLVGCVIERDSLSCRIVVAEALTATVLQLCGAMFLG